MSQRAIRSVLVSLAFIACGDDPAQPPAPLTVQTEGRLERGAEIRVLALRGADPAAGATLRAEPESAVQWSADGVARLLETGTVTFHAAAAGATGSLTVTIAAPPSIVFESIQSGARSLWRLALDGADLIPLTDDPAEDASPSSAGGAVYFLSYRVAPAAVFSVPAGGGTALRVTTVSGAYAEPAISPDGQRLAFLRHAGGVPKLFVSDRSGSNAQRVTNSGGGIIEVSPSWSPDGTRLTFVSTASGNADVHVVAAAGGVPQPVGATGAPEVEPSWSPDGTRVIFARGSGGEVDLWAVTVATGAATRLTTRAGVEARPAWLPDGRVVFTVSAGAERQLHWLDPAAPDTLHRIPHTIQPAGRPVAVR